MPENDIKKRMQRSEMKITSASDQVHSQLVAHATALNSQGRDWMEELHRIIGTPPEDWTEADLGVIKTFAVFGAQNLTLRFVQSKLDAIAIAEGYLDDDDL